MSHNEYIGPVLLNSFSSLYQLSAYLSENVRKNNVHFMYFAAFLSNLLKLQIWNANILKFARDAFFPRGVQFVMGDCTIQ